MKAALARFMAVDYGEKRIGLAISDELGMIASPAGFIMRRAGKRPPNAEIIRHAVELKARGFVVGLPLDGDGNETEWAKSADRMAQAMPRHTRGVAGRLRRTRKSSAGRWRTGIPRREAGPSALTGPL